MIGVHTVDITNIKKILKSCPYYDEIVNYEFDYNDKMTINLIDWYKDLIFSCNGDDDSDIKTISQIDRCLYLYIKDNKFKMGLKNRIDTEGVEFNNEWISKYLVDVIVNFTEEYENLKILDFTSSRWI